MLDEIAKKDKKWRSLAYCLCNDRSLADDLVNDMYIKIHDIDEKYPGRDYEDWYIFRTIKNMFFNHLKKKKNHEPCDEIEDIKDEMLQQRKKIDIMLKDLTVTEQNVLLMTSEMSLRQCASEFNKLPFGTVSPFWFFNERKKALPKLIEIFNQNT